MSAYRILKGVGVEPQYKGFRIKYLFLSAGIFMTGLFTLVIFFWISSSIYFFIFIMGIVVSLIALMGYLSHKWGKWGHIYFFIKVFKPITYLSGYKRATLKAN